MKRLQKSDLPYRNMCELLDDCIVDYPGISAYDMCVGDYQFLLYKLRIVTYGSIYPVASICPHCGWKNEEKFDLDTLRTLEYDPENEKYREFLLPKS